MRLFKNTSACPGGVVLWFRLRLSLRSGIIIRKVQNAFCVFEETRLSREFILMSKKSHAPVSNFLHMYCIAEFYIFPARKCHDLI
jgi:hypothetical protein